MAGDRWDDVCNSIALHGFQIVRKAHKYSQSTSLDIELIAIFFHRQNLSVAFGVIYVYEKGRFRQKPPLPI